MGAAKAGHGEARAWAKEAARYVGEDCLLWPFSTSRGYGVIGGVQGGSTPAHRYVCAIAHGEPPPKADSAHTCGNRLCCNPRHLRWASRAENEADKRLHGTDNRGARHGMSKLSENDAAAIIAARKAGVPRIQLAEQYGLAPATIYDITSGRRWPHLQELTA